MYEIEKKRQNQTKSYAKPHRSRRLNLERPDIKQENQISKKSWSCEVVANIRKLSHPKCYRYEPGSERRPKHAHFLAQSLAGYLTKKKEQPEDKNRGRKKIKNLDHLKGVDTCEVPQKSNN